MSEITDFTRIYWKLVDLTDFTDFIEITEFTGKYQVFPWNAVPFTVFLCYFMEFDKIATFH